MQTHLHYFYHTHITLQQFIIHQNINLFQILLKNFYYNNDSICASF